MLLIAAVVTILPAIAVADVLITGSATLEGTTNGPVFILQPGSNYLSAHNAGSITWTPDSSGPAMGVVDLEGITNQSTSMMNVLDINLTGSAATGTLTLTVSQSNLPAGAIMYISDEAFSTYFTSSGSVQQIDLSGGGSVSFTVSASTTLYFAFFLPAGTYVGTSATLTGVYTA